MRRLLGLLCAATVAAACAGGPATTAPAAPPTTAAEPAPATATPTPTRDDPTGHGFPVTVEAGNGTVEITDAPERIVSLSPTTTEMLYAVGAGEQVVAVEENSDYPEDVPVTDLSGFDPNLEAIVAYEPDLVILTDDANDVLAGLERVEVPALLLPAAEDLNDVYDQITKIGAVTGHTRAADDVVADMREEIDALVERVPEREQAPTYYHELDPQLFTVTSGTFIGQIYELAGLENIADPADEGGQAGGYPQLSAEFLIDADPDVVFLADARCCGQSPESFAARPGFDTLTAVEQGNVFPVDDDIASRWGPRVVEFLRMVVTATEELQP